MTSRPVNSGDSPGARARPRSPLSRNWERGPGGEGHNWLALREAVARQAPTDLARLERDGPAVLDALDPVVRPAWLRLAARLAAARLPVGSSPGGALSAIDQAAGARPYFEAGRALARTAPALQRPLVELAADLARESPPAAIELLRAAPELVERLTLAQLTEWARTGLNVGRDNPTALIGYFRGQSRASRAALARLAEGLELPQVARLLTLYAQALTGQTVRVLPIDAWVVRRLGWVRADQAASDGQAIYLPNRLRWHATPAANFALYKVLTLHQTGYLQWGTFNLRLDRASNHFRDLRPAWLAAHPPEGVPADAPAYTRFFASFPDRWLAKQIFGAVEGARIDQAVLREYRGSAALYRQTRRAALADRPALASLREQPPRGQILEAIVRASLGDRLLDRGWPLPRPVRRAIRRTLERAAWSEASVEDSAEATIRLYLLARRIAADHDPDEDTQLPLGAARVPYRGALSPELVQLLRVAGERAGAGSGTGGETADPAALIDLMRRSGEAEGLSASQASDREQARRLADSLQAEAGQGQLGPAQALEVKGLDLSVEQARVYDYPEWDYRLGDYRPNWCRLRAIVPAGGRDDWARTALERHAALVIQIRKQFEELRPESRGKLRRRLQGEEIDFDALVEARVQRAVAGVTDEKLYWERRKRERDVAVAVLLDCSGSTAATMATRRATRPADARRVIDLEREGLLVLGQALALVGDRCGLYGFSGAGRTRGSLIVLKDFNESFEPHFQRRLDTLIPFGTTRLALGIRHVLAQLAAQPAQTKLLLLLSDGAPQDVEYGMAFTDRPYALRDTAAALLECQRLGVRPLCLLLQEPEPDWLDTVARTARCEVLHALEALPRRLPLLYSAWTR